MCKIELIQIDEKGSVVQSHECERNVMPHVPVVGDTFSWYGFIYHADVVAVHYFYAPEDHPILKDALTITVRLK